MLFCQRAALFVTDTKKKSYVTLEKHVLFFCTCWERHGNISLGIASSVSRRKVTFQWSHLCGKFCIISAILLLCSSLSGRLEPKFPHFPATRYLKLALAASSKHPSLPHPWESLMPTSVLSFTVQMAEVSRANQEPNKVFGECKTWFYWDLLSSFLIKGNTPSAFIVTQMWHK